MEERERERERGLYYGCSCADIYIESEAIYRPIDDEKRESERERERERERVVGVGRLRPQALLA
jgi:hypothetical protein